MDIKKIIKKNREGYRLVYYKNGKRYFFFHDLGLDMTEDELKEIEEFLVNAKWEKR